MVWRCSLGLGVCDGRCAVWQPRSPAAHDRAKQRFIAIDRPFLAELGVTTPQHQLVPAMACKWKQINNFVEVFAQALASSRPADAKQLRAVDFGSGKGYLTFAVHDWLQQARGVVPGALNVMIALHACDVATDHALYQGLRAGANIIMCSPCCHKQIRPQLPSAHPLRSVLRHGVHREQQAEMLTDSLRALLLESQGYETQGFELVSLEHTSKNKMILAVKRLQPASPEPALAQARELKYFYGIREQCLETLLMQRAAAQAAAQAARAARAADQAAPRTRRTHATGSLSTRRPPGAARWRRWCCQEADWPTRSGEERRLSNAGRHQQGQPLGVRVRLPKETSAARSTRTKPRP